MLTLQKKTGERINVGIESLSFIALCFYFFKDGNSDPGDVLFLFIYESSIMLVSYAIFFLIFNTWLQLKQKAFQAKQIAAFIQSFLTSLFGLGGLLLVSFIGILFLNQLTLELLIGYLQDNEYEFKTIQVLSESGLYLESETRQAMEQVMGKKYSFFFYFIGFKYLIVLIVDFFSRTDLKTNSFASFSGLKETAIQIVISPISMFLACILLVILTAIWGTQYWIVFACLISFRLLFMYFFYVMKKHV
jgi:hypothetical protein